MKTKLVGRLLVLIISLGLAYIHLSASAEGSKVSDGEVAIVNGAAITQGDLDRELMRVRRQFANEGRPFSESRLTEIKKEIVETLIDRELLYQGAKQKGINVDDREVIRQFNILKERFPNETDFKSALIKMKISEADLKSQLRKGMAVKQLVDKEFAEKVVIPEKEARGFYNSRPELFKQPERVHARHILIKVDPGSEELKKVSSLERLKDVRKRLEKGEDFEALAKEYSEGPSAKNGGDLGYFRRGQMVKPFEEAAFSLPPGKVSDIIETRFGYHLIKVIDKKPESIIDFDNIKDKLQDYLKQQRVQEKLGIYVKELKARAKVERLLFND